VVSNQESNATLCGTSFPYHGSVANFLLIANKSQQRPQRGLMHAQSQQEEAVATGSWILCWENRLIFCAGWCYHYCKYSQWECQVTSIRHNCLSWITPFMAPSFVLVDYLVSQDISLRIQGWQLWT